MVLAIASWIVAGIVMGALANGARWGLAARRVTLPHPHLVTLGLGAAGALLGAIGSTLLFGPPFALPAAIFGGGIAATGGAWLAETLQARRAKAAGGE